MATTTTVLVLGALSVTGFFVSAVLPDPQAANELPWKDIAGGSAALLMLGAMVIVLRHLSQDRAAQTAERTAAQAQVERLTAGAQKHVESVADVFNKSTANLMDAHREDSAVARRELHDLIRELKRTT